MGLWLEWRPWIALIGIVAPAGVLLSFSTGTIHGTSGLYLWILRNRQDIDPAMLEQLGYSPGHGLLVLANLCLALGCWSWCSGLVLGSLSRKAAWLNGALFCVVLVWQQIPLLRRQPLDSGFGMLLLLMPLAILVVAPSLWAIYEGCRGSIRPWIALMVAVMAIGSWLGSAFPLRAPFEAFAVAGHWPIFYVSVIAVWQLRLKNGVPRVQLESL